MSYTEKLLARYEELKPSLSPEACKLIEDLISGLQDSESMRIRLENGLLKVASVKKEIFNLLQQI